MNLPELVTWGISDVDVKLPGQLKTSKSCVVRIFVGYLRIPFTPVVHCSAHTWWVHTGGTSDTCHTYTRGGQAMGSGQ